MGYVSIERSMRGFFYTRDWNRLEGFWKAMQYNIDNENDEIEWANLLNENGVEVARYNRGCEIPKP